MRTFVRLLVCAAVFLTAFSAFAGFAGNDLFLPAAGRVSGAGGSQFYTTVWMTNPGGETVDVQLTFLPAGRGTPLTVTEQLLGGETKEFENIAEGLFHAPGVLGGIRFRSSGEIVVSSRIFNQNDGMTAAESQGAVFSAVPASFAIGQDEAATLQGVAQNLDFRYNYIMLEITGAPVVVQMDLLDRNGVVTGSRQYALAGYEQLLVNVSDVGGKSNFSNARIRATIASGEGRVVVAGSLVSNRSQDTTGFEMSYKSNLLAENSEPGVVTLNGLKGDLTLAGTGGVSISTSGNAISISAQGVRGPQGPAGPSGVAGAPGPQGIPGGVGPQGIPGADGTDGTNGLYALVLTSPEPAGLNCATGGVKIEVGLDANGNGGLDVGEIDPLLTRYTCNGVQGPQGLQGVAGETGPAGPQGIPGAGGPQGAPGVNGTDGTNGLYALVVTSSEPAGANCSTGGIRIEAGLDANGNAALDAGEINPLLTSFTCNGVQGPQGLQGVAGAIGPAGPQGIPGAVGGTGPVGPQGLPGPLGPQGAPGVNGTDGTNGLYAIVATSSEPAGANCSTGGIKIEAGLDANGNAALDAGEINPLLTSFTCNGAQGPQGLQGVAGATGPIGPQGIPGAVGGTGPVGPQGVPGPVGPQGAPGANGTDGTDGLYALVVTSTEPAGANCATGGIKVEVGLDANANGSMDVGEIDPLLTRYTCNGAQGLQGLQGVVGPPGADGTNGTNGVNGLSALVGTSAEPAGANCATGGMRLQSGLDLNGNGTLDAGEIDVALTRYVCNGAQGPQGIQGNQGPTGAQGFSSIAMTTSEPAGATCATGGVKLQFGLDMNLNGTLDAGEINASLTRYLCNGAQGPQGIQGAQGPQGSPGPVGAQGLSSVAGTSAEPAGANCATGGVRLDFGLDANGNGVLDSFEVNAALRRYVCNGAQGPQGIQGPQGLRGEQGIQGLTGPSGPAGSPGPVGPSGLASLVNTTAEPAGANCASGGTKFEVGLDSNGNGVLDPGEVNAALTRYVCNGGTGVVSVGMATMPGAVMLTSTVVDIVTTTVAVAAGDKVLVDGVVNCRVDGTPGGCLVYLWVDGLQVSGPWTYFIETWGYGTISIPYLLTGLAPGTHSIVYRAGSVIGPAWAEKGVLRVQVVR